MNQFADHRSEVMYEEAKRGKIGEQSDRGVRNGPVILPVSS